MKCENCSSFEVQNKGIRFYGKNKMYKFSCKSCGHEFALPLEKVKTFTSKIVITSAVARFPLNRNFLAALKTYCDYNDAELVILPVNHGLPYDIEDYDEEIREYVLNENATYGSTIIAGSNILSATLESPLHGMNGFSKGKNVVFGHPQVQLRTLPRKSEKYPPILTTTGTVSVARYAQNKTAQKAKFHHSFSALLIDGDNFRHLNFDGNGFFDLTKYYNGDSVEESNHIEALITGDEHVMFYSEEVFGATYGEGGIVDVLKPKRIVRHDVLDCYSISHHHKKSPLIKYAKHVQGVNDIEKELKQTLDFIISTTPEFAESFIIPSNHNSHLERWINEADPKADQVNMKLYHHLMWLLLEYIDKHNGEMADPFHLWAKENNLPERVKFLDSNESFMLLDIDMNNHGDKGVNGSRGSRNSFRELGNKCIIGHSHSPGIEKGVYQVGTSSNLRMEYNKGLSSWHNCHCVVYPNGKRQLIFINNGNWK